MTELEKNLVGADDNQIEEMVEENVIVFTDEKGDEVYYQEDIVITLDDKEFAILVPCDDECECEGECECEIELVVARIDKDEDGEPLYVDPTEEEYQAIIVEYEKMCEAE